MNGNFLWQNIVLTLCKILENSEFNGGLQIYFLGLPLMIGLIVCETDSRLVKILLKKFSNILSGEELALQIRYLT